MLFTQYYLSIHWIKESKKQLLEMFSCLSLCFLPEDVILKRKQGFICQVEQKQL